MSQAVVPLGTGPAGPILTPDEWIAVHHKLTGIKVDDPTLIESARLKVGVYLEKRQGWREDAQRKKLDRPL